MKARLREGKEVEGLEPNTIYDIEDCYWWEDRDYERKVCVYIGGIGYELDDSVLESDCALDIFSYFFEVLQPVSDTTKQALAEVIFNWEEHLSGATQPAHNERMLEAISNVLEGQK